MASAEPSDTEQPDARPPDAGAAGRPGAMEDAVRRLEQRLDHASAAAERLLADAAGRMAGHPPPAGWQQRAAETEAGRGGAAGSMLGAEADLLIGVLASVRDRIPPELQQRLAEAVREVLLALRALIDWYLERTEARRARPSEVQDIPIL